MCYEDVFFCKVGRGLGIVVLGKRGGTLWQWTGSGGVGSGFLPLSLVQGLGFQED